MKKLTGKIKVITGIHIGANKDSIGIGGIDSPVIKDIKNYPYIPGSSLKGKIRSLLAKGQEIKDENKEMRSTFGTPDQAGSVIFRDAFLCLEDIEKFKDKKNKIYEEKMETAIDRSNGKAKRGSLRTIERTITDISFNLEIIIKKNECINIVKEGLNLLKDSYIGGMGTRGYGQIEIINIKEEEIV